MAATPEDALSQGLGTNLNVTPYTLKPMKSMQDVTAERVRLAPEQAKAAAGVKQAELGLEQGIAEKKAAAAEGIASEARKTSEAAQKRLSEFPYPEFHPTKDNIQSLGGLFSIVSTLGLMLGSSGKMASVNALKSMTGMMNGWRQGRADLFKNEAENFQKEFTRIKAIRDDIKADFDEYMKLLPLDREAAMLKAEELARKAGSNSIITAYMQKGQLDKIQEILNGSENLFKEKEKREDEARIRMQERLASEAFQERLQRERLEAEALRDRNKIGTAGPRAAIYNATGKLLPEKEALQVAQSAAALRLVTSLRERLKDPEVETGLKDISTSWFQKLKSVTSPEELDESINQLGVDNKLDANDKTLLFLKDSAILGLTIEQSLTGSRVPVFTQRMIGPIFDAKAYTKPTYDKLLSSREDQLYNVAEDFGFTKDEMSNYARVGKTSEPGSSLETKAKTDFGAYEPDKYDYRINPETGKVQRKAKG